MTEYYAHIDLETQVWHYQQGLVLTSNEPSATPAAFSLASTESLRVQGGEITVCGSTACGTASWLASGSHIEVVSTRTGERLAAHSFAAPNGGFRPRICHAVEVYHPSAVLLFVVSSHNCSRFCIHRH